MIGLFKRNITGDHVFTGLNQVSRSLYGFLVVALLPFFLTQEEQGYWFTFTGLAALALLADLGFSNIILQFAAHEFAYLHFDDKLNPAGSEKHLKKLSTFFVFSLKWTSLAVSLAFPIILSIGFFLLYQKQTNIHWALPWVIYMAASAVTFFNSTMLYFFEGCNSVGRVQKIRFTITVFMTLIMFFALFLKFGLFALPLSLLLSSVAGVFMVFNRFSKAIHTFVGHSRRFAYSWRREFMPLLGRYAISWASGYFIFQMYTPLMFHYHGAVEAGKIGITITLWMGLFGIANVWIYAATPGLNMHVAKKDWGALDGLFFKNLLFSSLMFLAGMAVILLLISSLRGKISLIDRFADSYSIYFLGIGWFFQLIVNAVAVYLRAHKEEPLVIPSLIASIYIVALTFLCAKYLEPKYFFLGYVSHYLWGIPWVLLIFRRKRRSHALEFQ